MHLQLSACSGFYLLQLKMSHFPVLYRDAQFPWKLFSSTGSPDIPSDRTKFLHWCFIHLERCLGIFTS